MKTHSHILSLILTTLALVAGPTATAQLSAGNVRAAQRPATKLVDIDYDVTGVTTPVIVALEISADGGTTWTVPATSVTGAVGNSVTPGNNLRITWDAGFDWNLQVSTHTKFRVQVTDAPPGMSLIPGGTFTMGNSVAADTDITDAPTRTVNVSEFYMAQNLVTKAEWDTVRTWAISNGYTDLMAGAGRASNHPVQTVSWWDVVKWCNARSQQEGLTPVYTVGGAVMKTGTTVPTVNWAANGYRLPTEAEWEKAARGGLSGKRFPLGDTISHSQANYYANSSYSYDLSGAENNYHPTYANGGIPYTSPVGSFTANGYGLHDMAGNLWQWCWDWYGTYAVGTPTDPRGSSSGTARVFRGAGWGGDAYGCRTARRGNFAPHAAVNDVGFRIARSLTGAPPGMSLIPAGDFTMGNSVAADTDITDAPTRTVTVSAFYMAQNLVTKAEWDVVLTWALSNGYTDLLAGAGKAGNHPVQTVSWFDGVKWCNARSQQEGLTPVYTVSGAVMKTGTTEPTVNWAANGYRLPTEAEWEKAARGGLSGKRFPWGDTISHSQANYHAFPNLNYDLSGAVYNFHPTYAIGAYPYTSPVGSFTANGYGLYDMTGNVRQWCWDWYGTYVMGTPTDPRGVSSGVDRVLRSGAWLDYAHVDRVAYRIGGTPTGANDDYVGFRVVRSSVLTVTAESPNVTVDTRDYRTVTLTSLSNGSITGAGSYAPDTTATLTAIPATGYVFSTWTGDASGTTNPLTITMDSNKTVSATFSPDLSDGDNDGLTNFDESVTYGTNPTLPDSDSDGLTDAWEVGRGRFSIIAGSFTWAQARADAQGRGGELACFPTADRWNRAMETLGANALDNYTGLWIGASDAAVDGTWTWVNGEAFSFQPWGTGRPSNTPGNTLDFAEVSGGGGSEIGKWYDRSAATIRDGYLLETGYATNPNVADADGDGLNDGQEQTATTNPFIADTDGDDLNDGQEVNLTLTNPKLADTDNDNLNDAADDQDGDTLTNLAEITQHGTNPLLADTDNDELSDSAELNFPASHFALVLGNFTYPQAVADATAKRGRVASFPNSPDYNRMAAKARLTTQGYLWIGLSDATTEGTWLWTNGSTATYSSWLTGEPSGGSSENHVVIAENSNKWADAMASFAAAGYLFERVGLDPLIPDTDGDGLSDGQEVNTILSNPVLEDTDGDGLLDGAEVNTHGSSPLFTDTDADGLNDRVEVEVHLSNPALKDTDGDGFEDFFEVNTGFNPALATSTPDALSTIRTAVEFRFNAASGVSYRIEGSTDLDVWNTVETDIIGAGAVVTRFYTIENLPKRYFRARRN